jgi:hypothetical protein
MRRLINILRSVNQSVIIVFLSSLLFIAIYKFLLLRIEEYFVGASVMGEIFYEIALAIVASSIFYFVVVHLKDYHDKKIVQKILYHKLIRISNIKNMLLRELFQKSGIAPNNIAVSEESLRAVLSSISPNDPSPPVFELMKTNPNWTTYLIYFSRQTLDVVRDAYQFMHYLDSPLLEILHKIENSNYVNHLRPFESIAEYTYPDLSPFTKSFLEYITLIDELSSYLAKNKGIYS